MGAFGVDDGLITDGAVVWGSGVENDDDVLAGVSVGQPPRVEARGFGNELVDSRGHGDGPIAGRF